ncbi:hypothetical protein ACH5RR_012407 [Cinchona calisaya]|uniref:VQ domain-containing protein n=1 Tax=Cinchona calisaya TaxID=153742 RepID=A0ABD3A7N0_9GENT
MDSGNSGSLQSSSGDEEYDSRADSISAALMTNNNPAPAPHHIGSNISNNQQHPRLNASSIFDPLSNYFDTISRPLQQEQQTHNSSLLNLEMSWPKTLRSDPNSTEIINPMMISPSSFQSLFGSNQPHGSFSANQLQSSLPSHSHGISAPPVPENIVRPAAAAPPADQNNPAHVVRNPKKRSRASRRAPTTVLTTDTTNFRAMVQEFTGIPAPPFASSSFPRSRLDLYGTHSSSMMRSNYNPLDSPQAPPPPPPYLRRPFPQKVQLPPPVPPPPTPPFLSSSSSISSLLVDHAAIASPISTNNIITSSTASLSSYQLPLQGANLFNIPNPLLTSLLQSNSAKFPPTNPSIIGSKPPQGSSQLKGGVLNEFGLSQGDSLSGLPGLISSDQTSSRNDNNPVNWGATGVLGTGEDSDHQGQQVRSSGNGNNFIFSRTNPANGKKINNYSGSSSSFHGDKGQDNVAPPPPTTTRGEGTLSDPFTYVPKRRFLA